MHSTALPKKTHNNQYGGYLLAIAGISLLLFALTSGTFAVPFTSSEQISHTANELSAAGSGGLAAGYGVNVTASRAGGAVFDAAESARGAGNTDMTQADFSEIGGAKSGSPGHEPAWQEPDAEDGSDGDGAGEGGMTPSGVYMVEAEPDTPYIFSARGISSDLNGTYEPLVTAMEVDGSGKKVVVHNLSFSGCYDLVEKEITFTTSPNVSEFYVSMTTWECGGTFQVEDVVLDVYEAPLPGISDLAHTAGTTWINWTWANPADVRFAYVTVQLNGTYLGVTPGRFYNATGLDSGACYEIGVRTVDVGGNVSETEVNQTAETAAEGGDVVAGKVVHATKEDFEGGVTDGVEVQKYGVITLERKNLLENPSFEMESSIAGRSEGWNIYNPSGGDYVTSLDPSVSTSGSKSQKITFSSNGSKFYFKQHLYGVENNTDYTFSADVKIDDPDNMNAKLSIELWGVGGYITGGGSIVTESTSFTRLSMTVTTTSDTDEIRAIVHLIPKFSGAAGTIWVDSAQLEMNDNPTPYAPCYTTTSGEYISPPMDMGMDTTPYQIGWTSSVKPEGDIKFQIRSADSSNGLDDSPWHGPTSTEDYYERSDGDNLLLNPSLESDSDGDGVPDYTRIAGWGINDRNLTVVSDAYEGSKAVKVEITNYTSGDARWDVIYNGTIEEDGDYSFSAWHKENEDIGAICMAVGFKKADGNVVPWYSGNSVQSSANWKHDIFYFRTPSYEVTEIRLKLMLDIEGWIISDAYSLEKTNFGDEWRINPVHNNSRWIQYKVDFSTTDQTYSPSLHDATIRYGASVPELHWTNVLADDGRQKYAFKPGETANFKVEVLDFEDIANIDHVNISIFDASDDLVLQDSMAEGTTVSNVKRYYEYSYIFPNNAAIGLWKANIIAVNREGQNCSENMFLKIRESYTSPPQKMVLGAVTGDHRFDGSAQAEIEKYSEYPGLEIWKRTITWDGLEPEHDSFDEDYINKILEFMDGAHENGAKVQISLEQSRWSPWANDGDDDSVERYEYKQTERLAETWVYLADRLKDHPALDSYLIINEENRIGDVDDYLRSTNKVVSSIRASDSNINHRIAIRPNTRNTYTRTRIAQDGIQDYDYGNTAYPTSYAWYLTNYENPVSETSYLRMSKLRSSPLAYGCAGGVGEVGFMKAPMDTFGDEEKLAGFERAMSIAYDQGMDEFMIWGSGFSFADTETYFPKLKAYRDDLVTQPRPTRFDVRILIDNDEWFYTREGPESALNMSEQPYKHLVDVLDTEGCSWFYTHSDAVPLQNVCYKATITFSEIKGKSEAAQDVLINQRLEGITPSGTKYL